MNLEYLGRVVFDDEKDGVRYAYPDTLVGTDSHTTMINGLGVLGWGVGGIEAEAAMLGQPVTAMLIPQVIGVKLLSSGGSLDPGATATPDLVLTVTALLAQARAWSIKFVEFFGDGLANLPLADRATIANMSPEFGSTCAIFPVDAETLRYLELTGRSAEQIELVAAYAKAQGLWRENGQPQAHYSEVVELDLGSVEPEPRRPAPAAEIARRCKTRRKKVYRAAQQQMAEERAQKNPQAERPCGGLIAVAVRRARLSRYAKMAPC